MAYDPANRGGGSGSNYTQSSYRSNPSISGNWNTGGQAISTGSFANGYTPISQPQQIGGPKNSNAPRTVAPVPLPKPMVAPPVAAIPAPAPAPVATPPVQRPFSTYVRSPYTNNPTYTPPAPQRPPSTYIRSPYTNNPTYTPRGGTSTHYKTTGPAGGQFRGGGGAGGGGRMGAGYARGGDVKKSSVLAKIKARAKPKAGIDTRPKVTAKKTPWKRSAMPAFAKGGAVEKFMAKYPDFKLA